MRTIKFPHIVVNDRKLKRCCSCVTYYSLDKFGNDCNKWDKKSPMCKSCTRKYQLRHKKKILKRRRERYQNNMAFKMICRLRSRLYMALKHGSKKHGKTKELLGANIDDVKSFIEEQFQEGMTWDNIHIDHMMPCKSFDMNNKLEQQKCFHYTNLQPLLANKNLQKSAKIVYDMKWTGEEWLIRIDGVYASRRSLYNLCTI